MIIASLFYADVIYRSFQTRMTFFIPSNAKRDILKNVQAALFHTLRSQERHGLPVAFSRGLGDFLSFFSTLLPPPPPPPLGTTFLPFFLECP